MEYDLKIAGGVVHDGTGAPGRRADVGIRGDRIAAVGEARGDARRTIDATGLVVAPGFVDIHTHYDAQALWDPGLSISPWHGVTTVVVGNCGFGIAPTRAADRDAILRTLEKVEGMSLDALRAGLGDDWDFESFPEYLDALASRGVAINVAAFVGHTPVRRHVLGDDAARRAARPEEIARMRALVREAMEAGAIGFATSQSPTHVGAGGEPVPSRAADLAEIAAIATALRDVGRGVVQATIGPSLFLDELAAVARATGRPVTWTALLGGVYGPGGHRAILERTAALAADDTLVVPQVSCRPLLFDFDFAEPFLLESFPFFAAVSRADRAGKKAIYRDPGFRARFREATRDAAEGRLAGRWERTWISLSPAASELEERRVADVARERGIDPVDLVLDLALDSDLALRLRMAVANLDRGEVRELLTSPHTALGLSDAGAHASQLCDACFPTDLLGSWVRDDGAIELADAIRMLTSRPAELLGIDDRGRLAVGLAADVVVLDPATVAAGPLRRVRDLPAGADRLISDARGIAAVVVNGRVLREGGADALGRGASLPGRVLRGGRAPLPAARDRG